MTDTIKDVAEAIDLLEAYLKDYGLTPDDADRESSVVPKARMALTAINAMQIREMTVDEVAEYLDKAFFKKLESTGVDSLNSTEAAQALAKLGTIKIKE